jgi:hypothetical protein
MNSLMVFLLLEKPAWQEFIFMTADTGEVRMSTSPPPPDGNSPEDSGPLTRSHGRKQPLGPLVQFVPLDHPVWGRVYAACLAIILVAGLWLASGLHPRGDYLGTHRQLHLPPCGFYLMTGYPCPTCGMTTAFAYTVHGQIWQAVRAQLAGFLIASGVIFAAAFSVVALFFGQRPSLNWYRVNPVYLVWAGAGFVLAAWLVKIVWGLAEGDLPAGE